MSIILGEPLGFDLRQKVFQACGVVIQDSKVNPSLVEFTLPFHSKEEVIEMIKGYFSDESFYELVTDDIENDVVGEDGYPDRERFFRVMSEQTIDYILRKVVYHIIGVDVIMDKSGYEHLIDVHGYGKDGFPNIIAEAFKTD